MLVIINVEGDDGDEKKLNCFICPCFYSPYHTQRYIDNDNSYDYDVDCFTHRIIHRATFLLRSRLALFLIDRCTLCLLHVDALVLLDHPAKKVLAFLAKWWWNTLI